MVQQRQGYMASVRMLSQRTIRPETLQIPGGTAPDGSRNFFLADGVTTLFRDGTEYGSTSGQEIFRFGIGLGCLGRRSNSLAMPQ